ncbi:MAG: T9SS type A sorting domain-containing protein [Bacteroidetes bacterium]|jgi:hypothetical protein|nr:T9SS type A sorting domain-containing protein [Bacteroidota bacterium]MBT6685069.1 T9SS type A sorting domain-containing protein [Bacteroidota bacterium]MBT7144558.1 T9SS type A sorting domain-containing protein [Bacteroidota bacterium]MBT7491777.1 T9SS type A sorting domain-containing protein [Bacteroidota bacterium]
MKRFLFFSLIGFFAIVLNQNVHSNVLWTNDFSNSSDWIISNETNDNQNWVITNNSAVPNITLPFYSSTYSNGFALFDSDGVGSNGGTQDASITISNSIDFSGYTNIVLSCEQIFRRYQGFESTYIGISTDGINWSYIEVNTNVGNGAISNANLNINISQYAENEPSVWIRFRYVGVWDYAWAVDDISIDASVLSQLVSVNPNSASQGESLTVSLSGQNTHFLQGTQTVWFNQGSSTIYGTTINPTSETLLDFEVSIPVAAPLGLWDVNFENLADGFLTKPNSFTIYETIFAPSWSYTLTSSNHTVLVPGSSAITIDGIQIDIGDYIGVFFDSLGTLACAGYIEYTGANEALSAWGVDIGNDGFVGGEEFTWILWDASSNSEHIATATYDMSGSFPNSNTFVINGMSGIQSLIALTVETQAINLTLGWNIFSTYINPFTPLINDVFANIVSETEIVKSEIGEVYWPAWGINNIGYMVIGKGYQAKMINSAQLNIDGIAAVPETTGITINTGWGIIGYLRQSSASIVDMLSTIVSDVEIVKNEIGGVYWPVWNVNGIGNMVPGKGYQIKMNNSATLFYPSNTANVAKANFSKPLLQEYNSFLYSGENMTLGIPLSAWEIRPENGDEIGVFNQNEELIGASVFDGQNMAIAIWGDDFSTKEISENISENQEFTIKIWNKINTTENRININSWLEGNNLYSKDAISIVSKLSFENKTTLLQNTPNPFSDFTEIPFYISEKTNVKLCVYNLFGEMIYELANTEFSAGNHSIKFNSNNLSSGTYIYSLSANEANQSKYFTIAK